MSHCDQFGIDCLKMLFVVRVVLQEGESLSEALERFNKALQHDIGRPWHKHRYGYYEKPSRLRRKYRRMRDYNVRIVRNCQMNELRPRVAIRWIDLETLFQRTGPNAAGR